MNATTGENHRYERMSKLAGKNKTYRLSTPDCLSLIPEINFKNRKSLLDVGCRNGRMLFTLASYFQDYELHGLDIDPIRIRKNQSKNKFPNVQFHCAPAEDMPFDNEYFDIIVCTNALHHFPQRVRALDEMHRVLKGGGEFYIMEGIKNKEWKNRFDKTLRQSKFIHPRKKILPRTALLQKSYFVHYEK